MYVNLKVLKKLMKEAFKGAGFVAGLLPGGFDGKTGLVLQASAWAVWIEQGAVPNPLKGILVEMAGRYPDEMELFRVGKMFPEPKLIEGDDRAPTTTIVYDMTGSGEASEILPISYSAKGLDLLRTKETRHVFGVNSDLMLMYDIESIDFKMNESFPIGPILDDAGQKVHWMNELCCLAIGIVRYDLSLLQQSIYWLDVNQNTLVDHQYTIAEGLKDPDEEENDEDDEPDEADTQD